MNSDFSDYDVASAIWKGMRPYQEDSLSTDFHAGLPQGFAIIADGMGGHAAGDVASNLAAVQGAGHLKGAMQDIADREENLPGEIRSVIEKANAAISDRVGQDSRVAGMGTTLLAVALVENRLYWGSVGDSPLYLVRDGALRQLNQDHSMAPVIAAMVERGEITPEQGKQHPDRNALTSVLMGERIEKSDVPDNGFELLPEDVLIAASDGLQFLSENQICERVRDTLPASSAQVCNALMQALKDLEDPQQDNSAIVVIQRRKSGPEVSQETLSRGEDASVDPSALSSRPSADNQQPRTRILSNEPTGDGSSADDQALESEPAQASAVDATGSALDTPAHAEHAGNISSEASPSSSSQKSMLFFVLGLAAIAAVALFLR
ncbi:MAG: PP2C family protein-serine/threonine phosphatase [Hyphomicrobiales bacterium]